jgi:hypothetical protein
MQADAIRDAEDKVRQQLKLVATRLREAREEQALERRLSTFESNEAIMDEQATDLRVTRTSSGASVAPSGGASGPVTLAAPAAASPAPQSNSAPASVAAPSKPGEDVRAQTDAHLPVLGGALPDDLPSLLAREKKLKAMAEELERQARGVEAKAQSLR